MGTTSAARVLIAEDNDLLRDVLRSILVDMGYAVVGEARNGRQAVALAQDQRPDVVLMDLDMPEMDGLQATRLIQASCPAPVVILTVHESSEMVQQASEAGAGAYLVKPPDPRALERAIIVAQARFGDMMELRRLNARLQAELVETQQQEERLRYQSTHDCLTGLYNRDYLTATLARLERSQQLPVSIVVVDVDGLKRVNDTLGHAAGDELLRRTAQVLRATFRTEDVIARVGGDEFVVLLPGADAAAAERVLARARLRLTAHNEQHPDLPLSLSLGAATGLPGMPLAEVLKLADQRMYQEKQTRRSRSRTAQGGNAATGRSRRTHQELEHGSSG